MGEIGLQYEARVGNGFNDYYRITRKSLYDRYVFMYHLKRKQVRQILKR